MLKEQIEMLEYLFDRFNESKFGNKLPLPVITIQSAGRQKCVGWCTVDEVWVTLKNPLEEIDMDEIENNVIEKHYEINICAEAIGGGTLYVAEILLHEMVHLSNLHHGIVDCSKNGRHNKIFKEMAEAVGLIVEKGSKGWDHTELTSSLKCEILEFNVVEVFNIIRQRTAKVVKSAKPRYKYQCGNCGIKITTDIEDAHIKCINCDEEFEQL